MKKRLLSICYATLFVTGVILLHNYISISIEKVELIHGLLLFPISFWAIWTYELLFNIGDGHGRK